VPEGASVIDIGAGPGGIAAELTKKGCEVAVVDQFAPTEKTGKVKVFTQDLDEKPRFDVSKYKVHADARRHRAPQAPEDFIETLRKQFDYETKTLVLTTPNIAFGVQRAAARDRQFNYGKAGILDATHTRLFTFRSIQRLLKDAGYRIRKCAGVPAPFPEVFGQNALGLGLLKRNELAIGLSKTLFSYQVFIVAESTPDVDFVLDDSKEQSTSRSARHKGPSADGSSAARSRIARRRLSEPDLRAEKLDQPLQHRSASRGIERADLLAQRVLSTVRLDRALRRQTCPRRAWKVEMDMSGPSSVADDDRGQV